MGSPNMQPVRDASGCLRPDLDFRDVPASVMAAYLGIDRSALSRRWIAGVYPRAGGRTIGRYTYFRPRVLLGIDHAIRA